MNTPGHQLENNIKIAAAGILEEIGKVAPKDRQDSIHQKANSVATPAFFKHYIPDAEQKALAEERNALSGKDQPRGTLKLQDYFEKGWWGASLRGSEEVLEHPLTEAQIFRFYFMGKVHVEAALRAVGEQSGGKDAAMKGA